MSGDGRPLQLRPPDLRNWAGHHAGRPDRPPTVPGGAHLDEPGYPRGFEAITTGRGGDHRGS
ncbi:MAG: hypothetical protein ACLP2J_04550, partial [Acidimicrobiales bacterium]